MKTIGFIDYYISEWHANNYPNWIKEICAETGDDFCVKYAWAEEDVSPVDGRTTDEWCEAFGVERCSTIDELCQKADYVLILSPSNPEKHLKYAKAALKFKKNTYIDKTFAPDITEAKAIFDLAGKYGTKFFSSSALRYSDELGDIVDATDVITYGGGSNIEEYIIHQIEICVKLLHSEPTELKVQQQGANQYVCTVRFKDNKNATMIYGEAFPFGICVSTGDGKSIYKQIQSDMFKNLLRDILRFYKESCVSFDINQTLTAMNIRTGVIAGLSKLDEWIGL